MFPSGKLFRNTAFVLGVKFKHYSTLPLEFGNKLRASRLRLKTSGTTDLHQNVTSPYEQYRKKMAKMSGSLRTERFVQVYCCCLLMFGLFLLKLWHENHHIRLSKLRKVCKRRRSRKSFNTFVHCSKDINLIKQ